MLDIVRRINTHTNEQVAKQRSEMSKLKAAMEADIKGLRGEMKGEMDELKQLIIEQLKKKK